jgi:thymidine kinase
MSIIHAKDHAVLHLIFGPMFSGKSTEGIRRIRQYAILYGKDKTLCIKFSGDTRYTEEPKVSTHDLVTLPAMSCNELMPYLDTLKLYRAIFIDEGQFFKDIVQVTKELLKSDITVIVSGLDGDYKKEPFSNNWLQLIPYSNFANKLTAICKCGNPASFTSRISNDEGQTVIGGSDKYEARCDKCYV